MAKRRRPPKRWVYAPSPQPVAKSLRAELEAKAQDLINGHLKPQFVRPPPVGSEFNYIEDIYTKWHKSRYFYFCSQYRCPSPRALAPTFEATFARLEHIGNGKFNLAYMRDAGRWAQVFEALTLDECLQAIQTEPFFHP